MHQLSLLIKKVKNGISKLANSSAGKMVLLVVAIVYTVSPIDIIPDAIPLLGWLDDVGVDAAVLVSIITSFISNKTADYVDKTLEEAERVNDTTTLNAAKVAYAAANLKKTVDVNRKFETTTEGNDNDTLTENTKCKEMNVFK